MSHLVEFFHSVHLKLVKELKVLLVQQFVSVDSVGLVKVDLQQVHRCFQTLTGAEQDALKKESRSNKESKGQSLISRTHQSLIFMSELRS